MGSDRKPRRFANRRYELHPASRGGWWVVAHVPHAIAGETVRVKVGRVVPLHVLGSRAAWQFQEGIELGAPRSRPYIDTTAAADALIAAAQHGGTDDA